MGRLLSKAGELSLPDLRLVNLMCIGGERSLFQLRFNGIQWPRDGEERFVNRHLSFPLLLLLLVLDNSA